MFHDTLLGKYQVAKSMKKYLAACFNTWFTSKNGLSFQMKCLAKMENVFACGGLMASLSTKLLVIQFSYFEARHCGVSINSIANILTSPSALIQSF